MTSIGGGGTVGIDERVRWYRLRPSLLALRWVVVVAAGYLTGFGRSAVIVGGGTDLGLPPKGSTMNPISLSVFPIYLMISWLTRLNEGWRLVWAVWAQPLISIEITGFTPIICVMSYISATVYGLRYLSPELWLPNHGLWHKSYCVWGCVWWPSKMWWRYNIDVVSIERGSHQHHFLSLSLWYAYLHGHHHILSQSRKWRQSQIVVDP